MSGSHRESKRGTTGRSRGVMVPEAAITRILFALIALLASTASIEAAAESQPNVVLIFIEDLGYGDIGPFGNKVNQTPNLDRMAREGNVLPQFYVANTTCTPSILYAYICFCIRLEKVSINPSSVWCLVFCV